MQHELKIWKPITFSKEWRESDTSKLDEIAPSWFKKREKLKIDSHEYEDFLNRLKRQHAIETGIIEKLYDLKDGITETFIKEGFVESYLQHGDTNIPAQKLLFFLNDHLTAIDFVFDVVKNKRQLTKSFLLELHQLITIHQETTTAVDSLGNVVEVKLLKGQFKKQPNNPRRADGTICMYCPPEQTESEIDSLLILYQNLIQKNIKPVIIAAWFHHAFTQIHPFQDGNGRMARLLASLVFIQYGLFPFTVKRNEKKTYIEALEYADEGDPNKLVQFFAEAQKKNIELVLNWNFAKRATKPSIKEVTDIFAKKLASWKKNQYQSRLTRINDNRLQIFRICHQTIDEIYSELRSKIGKDLAEIYLESTSPDDEKDYWFSNQIVEYAKFHNYFFNRFLPRGWFKLTFVLTRRRIYQLIVTIHHYGYDDSTITIGAILEFVEVKKDAKKKNLSELSFEDKDLTTLPIEIPPHTISIEEEVDVEKLKSNIVHYLNDIISVALAQIASEIN